MVFVHMGQPFGLLKRDNFPLAFEGKRKGVLLHNTSNLGFLRTPEVVNSVYRHHVAVTQWATFISP